MASSYSDLKIELIATGEQSGTWGSTTNTNLGTAIEEAIVGYANAEFTTNGDLTLTLTDTNSTQVARNLVLNATSTVSLTTTRNLIVPAIQKPYYIFNNTSGGQSINVKTSAGTGVIVPNGGKAFVYVDGTNVVPGFNSLSVSSTVTYKFPTTDGSNGNILVTNGSGGLSWVSPSGGGDVFGPASSTANGIARFSGTGGKTIQNSNITIDNSDNLTIPGQADLRLADGDSSNYVALQAPTTVSSNATLNVPAFQTSGTLGYLNVPQSGSAKTAPYILTVNDIGQLIEVGASGSIEIPDATFAAGDVVAIFNNTSGGITITCTITTAYIAGTDSDKASVSLATRGVASILFISGTVCVISGNVT